MKPGSHTENYPTSSSMNSTGVTPTTARSPSSTATIGEQEFQLNTRTGLAQQRALISAWSRAEQWLLIDGVVKARSTGDTSTHTERISSNGRHLRDERAPSSLIRDKASIYEVGLLNLSRVRAHGTQLVPRPKATSNGLQGSERRPLRHAGSEC